jgi:precorrin-2 dehydrogenase / sirohydrochlorin ferrochelatase
VEVLAKEVCPEIKQSGVRFFETEYQKKFLPGYFMLYSCTNNEILDRQILNDGKEAGVLVIFMINLRFASLFRQPFIKQEMYQLP